LRADYYNVSSHGHYRMMSNNTSPAVTIASPKTRN
jgi:hypothetical protein